MAFRMRICIFCKNGIERRINAGEEEANGKLRRCKEIERIGYGLQDPDNTGSGQSPGQGLMEACALADFTPNRSRQGTGKASKGEDKARNKD